MGETKFTADHEWVRQEDDGTLTIGITSYAQEQLGDVVFVELPEVGKHIGAGEEAVVLESVKAAADIKMPVAGEVVAVNEALADTPEIVNEDPLESGWFLKVRPDESDATAKLIDRDAYDELTAGVRPEGSDPG